MILKAIYYDEEATSDSLCELDSNWCKVKDGKKLSEGYQFISELSKWVLRQIECGKEGEYNGSEVLCKALKASDSKTKKYVFKSKKKKCEEVAINDDFYGIKISLMILIIMFIL